ncbi:hypothetical protein H0H93_003816 [Arthromyces matolae]|nr:hypothetical protein H0H93_003816 [Arthromyces matolae]
MQNFALVAVTAYFLSAMIGNATPIPQPRELIDHAVPQLSNVPLAVHDTVGNPSLVFRSTKEYARSLESVGLPSLIQRGGETSEPPGTDSSSVSASPRQSTKAILRDIFQQHVDNPPEDDPTKTREENLAAKVRYQRELAEMMNANPKLAPKHA